MKLDNITRFHVTHTSISRKLSGLGVVWPLGQVTVMWNTKFPISCSYPSLAMLMEERPDFKDGVTEISWIDQPSKNIPSRFHSKVVIDDSGNPAVYKQIKIEVEERSCKFCSAKFSVAPSISRSDKEYCSDACKSKAYRFRKDKAVVLHNSGMSIPRIAAQLNVDEKQVMTWLRQLTTKS